MMVDSYGPTSQRPGYAVREQPQQQARGRQPLDALPSSSPGQGRTPQPLDEQYRPLVIGYLTALTGDAETARRLAREVMGYVFASLPSPTRVPAHDNTSRLAADLLLAATDAGLAYLRHVRALQLAGVGGPAPIPPARRAGPTQWLRAAFERFRPVAPAPSTRGSPTWRTARPAAPTHRLPTRQPHTRERENVSYEQVRRKILRAVLADLAPDDARCLALHLVAGLSAAESAYLLGVAPDAVAERVYVGVEAVAVRYDEALGMLGLSPSLFAQPSAIDGSTVGYQGPPTLRQRSAVTPTQRLTRTPPSRALARTAPLRAVHTLPAPPRASVVPVVSPPTTIPEPVSATTQRLTPTGGQVLLRRPLPITLPRGRRQASDQPGPRGAASVPVRSPAGAISG